MLKRIFKNKQGNFGLTTAFLMAPLMAMAGIALDFGNAYVLRNDLQNAADAAVVGAISEKSTGVTASYWQDNGAVGAAERDAVKLFTAQVQPRSDLKLVSTNASVTKTGNLLKSTLTYRAEVKTIFSQIIGKNTITFKGTATAEYSTQTFRQFYVLLDNTPSMGVGATTADINKMVANTSDKCAFACHIVDNGVENTGDYYNLAKKLGVTIRIDVVAQAVASLMDTAIRTRSTGDQYSMSVYTFGEKAEDVKPLEVASMTSDLANIKTKANKIQLMTIPYQGYNMDQQTSFDTALTQMKSIIGSQGTGASALNPEKVVFFVSDGVGDSKKPVGCTKPLYSSTRCQEPIDLKYCDALKANGIKIAVLYTTYLPLPTNGWYNTWIAPFQNQISTNMRACASEGLFFEVSPTQGIAEAMNALFLRIVTTPRLTG
ncbi:pilus assembly protein [Gellertiella hungarica]|uniref:Flp pilus assembly protein TadG n=1 Tax=Gellertiella hungarica TaxID=1572859 RepID=A0A7W6J454_9HYPH|nr:pilus assembly protein [Gellertiella hungarica]MBB4063722.1 Flp pilus assembly protein TadG [Gellertiella hungarica]